MIYGIGVDVLEPQRVERLLQIYGERFARRVLTEEEWPAYQRSARPTQFVANRFAAKEAFSKAIGLGMHMPMTWRSCEVLNAASGRPEIRLHGELARWFGEQRLRAFVSVSDEANVATAFVVVEKD